MYNRLIIFKDIHGHCNVKKRYAEDQKLGHWVHYQRTQWKKNNLAAERIQLLEDIGFVWMERASATGTNRGGKCSWDTRYKG
ncbi:hypothetical protein ACHAXS_003298 [Conticribra weissflogii]